MKRNGLFFAALFFLIKLEAQQWNYYGNAVQLSCQCFQLTAAQGNQAGSMWNLNTLNLSQPFDYNFNIFLGGNDGGADGLVFVLQNTNNTAPPSSGGGLGYLGFPNQSVGVEFDTWDNGAPNSDMSADHISINANGSLAALSGPVQMSSTSVNTEDGAWHQVRIVWNPATNTISVYFDGVFRISHVFAGGLVNTIFGGNPSVYFGWTGSTGGASNVQQVCAVFNADFGVGASYNHCDPTVPVQFSNLSSSGLNNITSYLWNFGDGTPTSALPSPTHTYASTGNYNVSLTITDQTGCTDAQTHVVSIHPIPQTNTTVTQVSCNGSNNGVINLNVFGGNGPYSVLGSPAFSLSPNGPTNFVASGLSPTTYTVYLTDNPTGCSDTLTYIINEPPPLSLTATGTNVTCNGLNNGSISINVSGGTPPYTYNGNPVPAGTTVINSLSPGTYAGTLLDFNGCSATSSVTITEPGPTSVSLVPTNNICNGGNTGAITANLVNGTGIVTYSWNGGSYSGATITNLVAGNYAVTATDQNNCTASNSLTLIDPPAVTLSVSTVDVSCFGGSNGSATANPTGGTAPYSYVWNPGGVAGATLSGLTQGNYTVTASDFNSCNFTASFTINQPANIVVSEVLNPVLCNGGSSGNITLTPSGGNPGYTYIWSPNVSSTNIASSLTAGTYNVTITDITSCSVSSQYTITQPVALSHTETFTEPLCFGESNASLSINVMGGTGTPNIAINGPSGSFSNQSGQFNNLLAGVYLVSITDANNCSLSYSVNITEPAAVTVSSILTHPVCFGYSNGSIQLTGSSGTAPYQYSFSNGEQNNNGLASGLSSGTYDFTITDFSGCTITDQSTLVDPAEVIADINPDNPVVVLGENINLEVLTNYSNSNYQWTPTPGLSCTDCSNPTVTTYNDISYQVVVTNSLGCTASATVSVQVDHKHDIFIPNVFTPNGDGNNDFFYYLGNKAIVKQVEFSVFNRWGEKVYESKDINFTWDGTFKGNDQPVGVYTYTSRFVFIDNFTTELYTGSLTILR